MNQEDKKKFLGNYIKEYRLKKGLTQAELAEKVNVGVLTISRAERGLASPSADIFLDIVKVLEIPIEEYIYGFHLKHETITVSEVNDFLAPFSKDQQAAIIEALRILCRSFEPK